MADDGSSAVTIRHLGLQPYGPVLLDMQTFTNERNTSTMDEIWVLQHQPVFTQGQAGKEQHLLVPTNIPVVKTDRGGQVTYHGPGQLVTYVMLDLKRLGMGVRQLVTALENALVATLAHWHITAYTKLRAPGVYVEGAKIASLGLRVRRNCSFHGLALNVDMDLSPFQNINPCGYAGLPVVKLRELVTNIKMDEVTKQLLQHLQRQLGYSTIVKMPQAWSTTPQQSGKQSSSSGANK